MSDVPKKSVTKVYGSTLLALRGGGLGVKFPEQKRYITLELPISNTMTQTYFVSDRKLHSLLW